jgi:hypothetical protein
MVRNRRNMTRRMLRCGLEPIIFGPGTTYKNNSKGILVFFMFSVNNRIDRSQCKSRHLPVSCPSLAPLPRAGRCRGMRSSKVSKNDFPLQSRIWPVASISCLTDGAPLSLLGRPNIRDDAYVYLLVGNCKFPGANNCCFGTRLTFLARAANVVRRRSRIDEGRASGSGFCLCSPSICKLVPKYIWIVLELLPCPSL